MQKKLTQRLQIEFLREGDILYQFPFGGPPEDQFDSSRHDDIKVYRITSISIRHESIRLVIEDTLIFCWPGDTERLTVNKARLVDEGLWWIN